MEISEKYSEHSLRRTSATVLTDSKVDVLALKRHGGSSRSYVAESLADKVQTANNIFYISNQVTGPSYQTSTNDTPDNMVNAPYQNPDLNLELTEEKKNINFY